MADAPYTTTNTVGLSKWLDGDNPGAEGINQNWDLIDEAVYNLQQQIETNEASINFTCSHPLKITAGVLSLEFESNLKLSDSNKLDTIQDIRTISTTIQFARIGFGGVPDATYKVKNYGDNWIVGNSKIEGYSSFGGEVDTNFRQKIYGDSKITGNLTIDGDIYIGGSINEVNVNDLNITDHAIRLNKNGDDTTALDGGVEMLGANSALLGSIKYEGTKWLSDLNLDLASGKTYKINDVDVLSSNTLGATVVYSSLTTLGNINQDLNLVSGKVFKINGTSVLSSTTLQSGVLYSSLTSVGTLTTGIWNATAINAPYLNYNTTNLKNSSNALNTIQDIATTSSPTFTNLTLTGALDQQGTSSSYFGSQNVLPKQKYYSNLGSLQYKWLTLHAAELWVETLVAQETIATIGGRILVGPTTALTADLAAADTTIHVKHNQMAYGDIAYLEANGKVEFIWINSSYSGSAGDYTYSVVRNLDGTGANDWYKGDAMFNTGAAGDGFIDIYSVRGVKSASQTGPTIVGNYRNSSNYNDWSESWAIGNLNNLYGYGSDTYGVGLGRYANSSSYITIDSTNGIRLRYKNGSGVVSDKITLDMSGNVSISGYLQVGNAASDVNSGTTTITGSKITTGTITLSHLNFTPVQTSNVIASINATSEGLLISGAKLTINSSTTFASGYDPSGKIASGGAASDINNNTTTISGGKITTSSITADKLSVTDLYAIGATIGGWSLSSTSISKQIYSGAYTQYLQINTASGNEAVYFNTGGSVPAGAIRWLGLGKLYDGLSWTTETGIGMVKCTASGVYSKYFWLSDTTTILAGFSFDNTKLTIGSTSAGFAFNTSSTRWLANSGSGFEVWNPSDTRLLCGTLDSSGNLTKGLAWNLNDTTGYDLKLVIAGDVVGSRFSTNTEFYAGSDLSSDGYSLTSYGMWGRWTNSSVNYLLKLTPTQLAMYYSSVGTGIQLISNNSYRRILIDNHFVPKFFGVTDTAPTTNLNAGDFYIGSNGTLCVFNGTSWKFYSAN